MRAYLLIGAVLAAGTLAVAEPGELFPTTPYEQAVEGRRAPEPKRPEPVAEVKPEPKSPPSAESPKSDPPVATPPTAEVKKPEPPSAVETANAASAAEQHFWSPYAASLVVPLLTAEQKAAFTKDFGKRIANAYSAEEKRTVVEALMAAAEKTDEIGVRRHLLAEALKLAIGARNKTLIESVNKPFVEAFETASTLPALHTRASAYETMTGVGTPSKELINITVDAFTDLALAQVQAGYPAQADASLRKSRTALSKQTAPDLQRAAETYYVQYWLMRSQKAREMVPRIKSTLAAKPEDPTNNTLVAALHLALYADLADAAACAAKSDKPAFQAFAKLVAPLKLSQIDVTTADGLAVSLKIATALLDVTPECGDTFDKYAIATYVESRLDELLEAAKPAGETKLAIAAVKARAVAVIEANKPPLPEELRRQLAQANMEERVRSFFNRIGRGQGWNRGGTGWGGRRGRGH